MCIGSCIGEYNRATIKGGEINGKETKNKEKEKTIDS